MSLLKKPAIDYTYEEIMALSLPEFMEWDKQMDQVLKNLREYTHALQTEVTVMEAEIIANKKGESNDR